MLDERLLRILVCPLTKKKLRYNKDDNELISEAAGLAFPVKEGIPIMLVNQARKISGDSTSMDNNPDN